MTDEEMVVSYKEGNQESFQDLINRYTSPLYNFTARLASKGEASDIVQEIFIKVWKNINSFDPKLASFKTWIFTIGRNTATDFLRKKHYVLFSEMKKNEDEDSSFAENIPDEEILPDIAFEKLENQELLDKVLSTLPHNFREVLTLHYQEEMTFAEIGKVLNKPLNTVKSDHRRALLALREKLI